MIQSDDHWLQLADAFYSAAVRGDGWQAALQGLAQATGSRSGELIGVGSKATVPFNIMTDIDPAFQREFVAAGGGDPAVNPRVRAGMNSAPLKVMADYDFISPEDYRRDPHYQEFARPWDVPFICLATLEKTREGLIGLAVVRSRKDGYINDAQRAAFASLASHVRAAVRTQMALENQGANLVTGTMEALAIPALVCDRAGRVQALTPSAEAAVDGRRGLQLRVGQLRTAAPADQPALDDAIAAAAMGLTGPGVPIVRNVIIRGRDPASMPMVLEVIALPRNAFEFTFAPRVLILVRGSKRASKERAEILRSVYALSVAEIEVALGIADGKSIRDIAAERGVGIETVRTQLKNAMAKLGVNRQTALVARLNQT